jgi:integration host factor subunit beta
VIKATEQQNNDRIGILGILKEQATMNKSDLIEALAEKEEVNNIEAVQIVNLIFQGFANALREGGRVEIRGFGSLSVRQYKGYNGRNPRTGTKVQVGEKRLPFFKVGRELKARVNG